MPTATCWEKLEFTATTMRLLQGQPIASQALCTLSWLLTAVLLRSLVCGNEHAHHTNQHPKRPY